MGRGVAVGMLVVQTGIRGAVIAAVAGAAHAQTTHHRKPSRK